MRPLRFLRTYLILGCAYVTLVIYLTLIPQLPQGPDLPFADKGEHLLAYSLMMAWFGCLAREGKLRLKLALGFTALGAALEVLQGLGGVRQMELADALANAMGAGLGWWITQGEPGRLLERLEKALPGKR